MLVFSKMFQNCNPKSSWTFHIGIFFLLCDVIKVTEPVGLFNGKPEALYKPTDHVVILNATNAKQEIYGKSNAWAVEFFSSWCGHCIHFAPIYKQFAEEVNGWKNLVKVAGIDCADEANLAICRDYEIMGYPTILFFPPNSPETKKGKEGKSELNRGESFNRSDKVSQLKTDLIEKLTPHFPQVLGEVTDKSLSSFDDVWKYVQKNSGSSTNPSLLVLLFENKKLSVWKELALRLSNFPEVRVLPFFKKNALYNKLGINNEWPAAGYLKRNLDNGVVSILKNKDIVSSLQSSVLTLIQSDNRQPLLQPSANQAVPHNIEADKTNGDDINYHKQENNLEEPAVAPSASEDIVSIEDLIHAVRNSLRNEVGILKTVGGWKRKVLKDYVHVLGQLFPADRREFIVFLGKLETWLDSQSSGDIQINEYMDKLTELELELHPWDIEINSWGNCKGTVPGRRGYTCSLWRLFHTLTILATQRSQETSVLPTIYGYVKEFFGCTECVKHFTKMVQDEGALTITSIRAQALWLWRAHNKVNLRLKGAVSEDPGFPKALYPSEVQCANCQTPDGSFDEDKVFEYLVKIYSRPLRTMQAKKQLVRHSEDDMGEAMPLLQQRHQQQSRFFSGTDYWIFCIVYISVAALLIFGYVHFKLGYRRRFDPFALFRKVVNTSRSMV